MSKTVITYKDIAIGAAEDASVSSSNHTQFSDLSSLPFGGLSDEPYITLEHNAWVLNGSRVFRDQNRVSFWSEDLSGADCLFAAPPQITVNFDQKYSSTGISLVFDSATGEYCPFVNIKWYSDGTLLDDMDFYPDGVTYFCSNRVEAYNSIVLTLNATNLPYRRAKLDYIAFGIIRTFGMSEIRSAKITNETSLSSLELPISRFSFTLDSREDVDFLFQLKQPLEVTNGGNLIGVYYIDKSRKTGAGVYNVESEDSIGLLDDVPFPGGSYLGGISAQALFTQIVDGAFNIQFEIPDTTVYGIIQPCSRREALMQVAFAWGALVSTDGIDGIRVFSTDQVMSEIGSDRVYTGVSVEVGSIVTEVIVTAHSYSIGSGGVEIGGQSYIDTTKTYSVRNPNVTATDKENVIKVDNATLVSNGNGQDVAQRLYDYHMKRNSNRAKIVWDGEHLGDLVGLPNIWGSSNTGHIAKMEITLSNTIAANCTSIGG